MRGLYLQGSLATSRERWQAAECRRQADREAAAALAHDDGCGALPVAMPSKHGGARRSVPPPLSALHGLWRVSTRRRGARHPRVGLALLALVGGRPLPLLLLPAPLPLLVARLLGGHALACNGRGREEGGLEGEGLKAEEGKYIRIIGKGTCATSFNARNASLWPRLLPCCEVQATAVPPPAALHAYPSGARAARTRVSAPSLLPGE